MKRVLYIFSVFLLFSFFPLRAQGAVQAELLGQREAVSEGEEFYLALKLTLPKGWHVYWKNSGDAGEPTTLTLTLPEGFEEVGRKWPAPEKFSVGTLTEYGYKNKAYLLVKIKAPNHLNPGEIIEISGRAVWLACHDECVPMAEDVAVLLTAGKGGAENKEIAGVIADLPQKETQAAFFETPDSLVLRLPAKSDAKSAYFFAAQPSVLTHSAGQKMKVSEEAAYLFLKKAPPESFVSPQKLEGTVVFYNVQGENAGAVEVAGEKTEEGIPVFQGTFIWLDFLTALLLAFGGGFLLNLMPCVFPVLSLKAFRLLNSAGENGSAERRKSGLSYTAGVLSSFAMIGTVLIGLRTAGAELGWGFQLQYPPFVLGLCLFIFFLGLVFSEVVGVGERLAAFGLNAGRNWGDFGTGILAVLVATPCAAPFMGTALGYGLMNPAAVTMSVFLAMGLGLSFPFLVLDFYPSLGRFLPKAGPWMVLFRRFLAFPLYGASAWLLWVLAAQEGSTALGIGLFCLTAVAFTAWLAGTVEESGRLKITSVIVSILTLALIAFSLYSLSSSVNKKSAESIEWMPYNAEKIQEYRQASVPVFIKFSAKWCLTCLLNEKTAFSSDSAAQAFREKGVAAFAADWTTRSDDITAALESFGRGGIPLYVYYAPHAAEPILLPQLITEKSVTSLFQDL